MSTRLKEKIGDELYNQILNKGLKENEFDFIDGFVPRARMNEINDKYKATEAKIQSYESQLAETKDLLKDSQDFKDKYSQLEEKYSNDIKLKDKEIANTTKRFLVEQALTKEGAKHSSLLMKEIDLDKLTVENDSVLGMTDVMKNLKESYSDLFIETTSKTNNNSNSSSQSSDSNGEKDWEEILKNYV